MGLRFEWDRRKATANLKKHGVSLDEASTVFHDPLARLFDAEVHSGDEPRDFALGHSITGRLLLVSFVERQKHASESSARGQPPLASEATMKKTSPTSHVAEARDELRKEYSFDYTKAKPNRFAGQPDEPRVVVVLDPEVAEVFETPDSVNEVLRALIQTMPRPGQTTSKSRRARTPA